ncbi:MAG: thioredoxin-disulfide reductase [Candidatus Omnitrophica bacterium]|jgi:thioredoxin reductase (NADPH)|nr:thioredoxin-disulfide reductase [Candidatus Omnitrophota bacterium]
MLYDLIIIGAGPAGLTAAIYAGRSLMNTLLIEKMAVGGRILLSEKIENYPGFPEGILTSELISRMLKQVSGLGVKIDSDEVVDIDCQKKTVKTSSNNYSAKTIIIATGARPRKLQVIGEDKYIGRGVSYCATCDAPFYKGKNVVIVGGGNAVAQEALYLTRFATSVRIIHRRQDLRAAEILQQRILKDEKIKFTLDSVVTEILGENKVSAVKVKNVLNGAEEKIACDGVFIYIGYQPETTFLKGKLELDQAGFILAGEDLSTTVEGVFVCGDCRKKTLYQVINACGDGAIAADSAYKYISK